MDAGHYSNAWYVWSRTLSLVRYYTSGIDSYNFLVFKKQELPTEKRTLFENGEFTCVFLVKWVKPISLFIGELDLKYDEKLKAQTFCLRCRVAYKRTVLAFTSLRGQTPLYLADECQLIANYLGRCVIFIVPTSTSALSQGPILDWTTEVSLSLDHESETKPCTVRQPDMDFGQFKQLLKTFFVWDRCALVTFRFSFKFLIAYLLSCFITVYKSSMEQALSLKIISLFDIVFRGNLLL